MGRVPGALHPELARRGRACRQPKKLEAIAQALTGGAIDETVEPWLLPRPDGEGEDEDLDEGDARDDATDDGEDDGVGAASFAGEGYQRTPTSRARVLWLGVLPENWAIVAVFGRCRMDAAVGMGGALWLGIAAAEVWAACRLSRIPRTDWPRLVDGVQLMGRIAARIANEKEREEADRHRRRKT